MTEIIPNDSNNQDNIYSDNNEKSLWEEVKYNSTEKDKLLIFISGLFLGASATVFNLKEYNMVGVILIAFLLILFSMALIFSLYGFYLAYKSTLKQYNLFCEGKNDPSLQVGNVEFSKKQRKIRKKYKSELFDKLALVSCVCGVILFTLVMIANSLKLFEPWKIYCL